MTAPRRIFLLSPASCAGERARLLFDARSRFPLAQAIRSPAGCPVGAVFAFLSALYFRGKLEYARTWARPPGDLPGVFVITPGEGLCVPERPVHLDVLGAWRRIPVDARNARYAAPLSRDARELASRLPPATEVVLLGSLATRKYVDVLAPVFGERWRFPAAFVGRGDMSRGGLLLRSVRERRELEYVGAAAPRRR